MIKKYIFLFLYRGFAQYLPSSGRSKLSKQIRYYICSNIFKYIGKNVNIERKAYFGKGFELEIGDNSGIGINCSVPFNIKIGSNVLMGPNVFIFGGTTHNFSSTNLTIREQGYSKCKQVVIGNDVWIGRDVLINHGRNIKTGTIIAARSVVTRDFPEYSIIGGNPAQIIRSRNL